MRRRKTKRKVERRGGQEEGNEKGMERPKRGKATLMNMELFKQEEEGIRIHI